MIFELFYSSTCLNIDILLLAVLINAMGVYVEQQHLQNEAVNTEIVCMTHLLKKGLASPFRETVTNRTVKNIY